jgi:hypothetical protein
VLARIRGLVPMMILSIRDKQRAPGSPFLLHSGSGLKVGVVRILEFWERHGISGSSSVYSCIGRC